MAVALGPATPARTLTRTYECPVCGRGVEIVGTGDFYPTAASASEVASLCRPAKRHDPRRARDRNRVTTSE